MKAKSQPSGDTKRKTLVQMAAETTVRDPAAHAKHQVEELDKTAKHSQAKRKKCNDQIEADTKEIAKLEEQIANLRARYDPLCEHLVEIKEQKKRLTDTLEQCVGDQKKIMGETRGVIVGRRQEESKMTKKMGSLELEILRGYDLRPESTFYQSRNLGASSSTLGSSHSSALVRSSASHRNKHANSAQTLPPLSRAGEQRGMNRNNSSMI